MIKSSMMQTSSFVRMFKPQFAGLVERGENLQTVRPIPKRMPKPGDKISLRALFIPLRGVYFDQFERGEKRTEYRQRGPRWNAETCAIGRRVVLSRGYGSNSGDAACITIQIDGMNDRTQPTP